MELNGLWGKLKIWNLRQRSNIFVSFFKSVLRGCATLQAACSFLWSMHREPLRSIKMPIKGPESSKSWDTHVLVYWHVHLSIHCFFFYFFLPHVKCACMCARVMVRLCLTIVFLPDNPAVSIRVARGSDIKQQPCIEWAWEGAPRWAGWVSHRRVEYN